MNIVKNNKESDEKETPNNSSNKEKSKRKISDFIYKIYLCMFVSLFGIILYYLGIKSHSIASKIIGVFGTSTALIGFIFGGFVVFQDFLEGGYSKNKSSLDKDYETIYRHLAKNHIILNEPNIEKKKDIDEKTFINNVSLHVSISERMENRLTEEIQAQGRKANTNLFMGVITALISVIILGWLSFQATTNFDYLLSHDFQNGFQENKYIYIFYFGVFISKITLSVTASIFSFFFLSTYRRNLGEIKFFQNELTNVQYRLVSIFMAEDLDLKIVLNELLLKNAEVERNFILKNGESTIELRTREIDVGETNFLMTAAKQAAAEAISSLKNKENAPETPEKK